MTRPNPGRDQTCPKSRLVLETPITCSRERTPPCGPGGMFHPSRHGLHLAGSLPCFWVYVRA